ncbi:MAG: TetR family transcriptional regulator [Longimicrobiales bacterium]
MIIPKAEATVARLMDAAEALVLEQGFAASSVDAIVARAGLTKGAFFHHFRTKSELAHALVERYAAADERNLEETMERAERLTRDPLQQLLIFVGLLEEYWSQLTEPYPGCLFASYVSAAPLFAEETHALIRRAMSRWRERVGRKLREVAARYEPRLPVDADDVADELTVLFEGAFILAKALDDRALVARQLALYRGYLELLFGAESGTNDHQVD